MWLFVRRAILVFVFCGVLVSGYFVPFLFVGNDEVANRTQIDISAKGEQKANVILSLSAFTAAPSTAANASIFVDTRQTPLESFHLIIHYDSALMDVSHPVLATSAFSQFESKIDPAAGVLEVSGQYDKKSGYHPQPQLGELLRFDYMVKKPGTVVLYFDPASAVYSEGRNFLGQARGARINILNSL